MSTSVFYNIETEDYAEVLNRKCKCGHKLSHHGFVDYISAMGYPYHVIYVSQCCLCSVDVENNKFACERFESA